MTPKVPARDYVTDVAAAALLVLSLALWWNRSTRPNDNLGVLAVTILSLVSLTFHYLFRAQALPFAWEARTAGIARAVANVPYALAVLAALVLDLVPTLTGRGLPTGVGGAATVGLAGATLAAVPRAAELDGPAARALGRQLRTVLLGLAVAAVGFQLVNVLVPLLRPNPLWYLGAPLLPWYVVTGLGRGVVVALPPVMVARGRDAWRPVVVVSGATLVGWLFVVEPGLLASTFGNGLALVVPPVAAALACAPAEWGAVPDRRAHGLAIARSAMACAAVVAGVGAATALAWIGSGHPRPASFAVVALLLGACGAAELGREARSTRWLAVAIALVAALGLANLVVNGVADDRYATWLDALLALGLPALAVWALVMPAAGRTLATRVDFTGDSTDL